MFQVSLDKAGSQVRKLGMILSFTDWFAQKWYWKALFNIACLLAFIIRYPVTDNIPDLVSQILYSLVVIFTYYQEEKGRKNFFLEQYSQIQQLSLEQDIINQLIPSSMLVIDLFQKDEQKDHILKIKYANDKCLEMFQLNDLGQLQEQINEVKGDPNSEHKGISLIQDAMSKIDNYDMIDNLSTKKSNPNKDIEIISVINSEVVFKYQNKFFNVKYSLCFWKGSLSLLVLLTDESVEKRNLHLEMLNQYKDKLLARVSHDLKTPLNCILSITDNITSTQSSLTDYLKIIHNNSILLLHMINDILDHSQIKYKKLRLNISSFNLREAILEIFDIFSFQIASQKIQLLLEGDCDIFIENDKNRLKQILINLISNSMKFTSEGYIKLTCTRDIENQTIRIEVTDTGKGMSQQIIDSLFKEFGSFDQSNLNVNGIGLGLVICKQLVGQLGKNDHIQVTSEINKGSCFSFNILSNNYIERERELTVQNIQTAASFNEIQINNIRRKSQDSLNKIGENEDQELINKINRKSQDLTNKLSVNDDEELIVPSENTNIQLSCTQLPSQNKQKQNIDQECQEQYNIMIVDDQQFNIIALRHRLKAYPMFQIDEFNFAEQAFEQIQKKHYDLVLSDIQMPILDGIEFVKKIRSLKNSIKQPIIVMITADSSQQYIQQLQTMQIYQILTKPIIDKNKFQLLLDDIISIL